MDAVFDPERGGGLLLPLAASVLLHAGVGSLLLLRLAGGDGGAGAAAEALAALPMDERQKIDLGVERSKHVTVSWLGFEDPTPHTGAISETDQAELALREASVNESLAAEAGDGGLGASAMSGPVQPQPREATGGGAARPETAADPSQGLTEATPQETPPGATSDAPSPLPVPSADREAAPSAAPAERPRVDPRPVRERAPGEEARTSGSPGGGGGEGAGAPEGGGQTRPAPVDTRESSATAVKPVMNVSDWSRPAARQGLRVDTVKPEPPDHLVVTVRPLNPVVDIDFGSDGLVRDVRWVIDDEGRPYSTGSPGWNDVVENAVYNWRASGDEIEALQGKAGDPTVTIRMRIVLARER